MAEDVAEDVVGRVEITVTDNNVSYDSNMSLPDMIFWIDMVKTLAFKSALEQEEV